MNWDEYFMGIAKAVALKSSDPSTKVGCVIVDSNNDIVSCGFNDFPSGADLKYMTYERPMKYSLIAHAETRALLSAKRSVEGCKAYVTYASCENCLKHLIVAGIKEIIYDKLSTNGKIINKEMVEIITRLMKATGIINRNMQGKSFLDDVNENE